jgi:DNA-binding NtrC family response regulator
VKSFNLDQASGAARDCAAESSGAGYGQLAEAQPALVTDETRRLFDFAKSAVGRRTLPSVFEEIRRCMLVEALRRARGNITHTACLLGLTRQAVQQMLSTYGLKERAAQLRNLAHDDELRSDRGS